MLFIFLVRIKDECDKDLAAATPAMEAAKAAVDCLDKASLTQLKSFKKPDEKVRARALLYRFACTVTNRIDVCGKSIRWLCFDSYRLGLLRFIAIS